ncbi:hypothetical protein BC628DRAFT_898632 [Trametes gibbosa]|nr:hypothetical protein BC628DRAFT_898632 [Trametes gibbosa]
MCSSCLSWWVAACPLQGCVVARAQNWAGCQQREAANAWHRSTARKPRVHGPGDGLGSGRCLRKRVDSRGEEAQADRARDPAQLRFRETKTSDRREGRKPAFGLPAALATTPPGASRSSSLSLWRAIHAQTLSLLVRIQPTPPLPIDTRAFAHHPSPSSSRFPPRDDAPWYGESPGRGGVLGRATPLAGDTIAIFARGLSCTEGPFPPLPPDRLVLAAGPARLNWKSSHPPPTRARARFPRARRDASLSARVPSASERVAGERGRANPAPTGRTNSEPPTPTSRA